MSASYYGQRPTPVQPGRGSRRSTNRDKRYQSARWRKLAQRIRARDGRCLIVPGCTRGAQMADHVIPATLETPDALFYDPDNLRGACFYHNTLRGQQDKAARELGEQGEGDRFSAGPFYNKVGSSRVDLQACKLEYSIVSPK